MRKVLLLAAAAFMAVSSLQAQRMGCLHSSAVTRASEGEMMPLPMDFDPQKTYRQAVVLISFNDRDFSMADTARIAAHLPMPMSFICWRTASKRGGTTPAPAIRCG